MFDIRAYVDDRIGVKHKGAHDEMICDCPFCGKRRKFWANADTGLWQCWSCRHSGNLVHLVSEIDGVSSSAARRIIASNDKEKQVTLDELQKRRHYISNGRTNGSLNLPDEFVPVYDREKREWRVPEYVIKRKIRLEVAAAYRLGFCLSGRYAGRLILPVYKSGELVYFQGRAMASFEPKYLNPVVDKNGTLYGLDEAVGATEVLLVEGPLDVLSLVGRGHVAVGLLGKSISEAQIANLKSRGIKSAMVMLDGSAFDDAVLVAHCLSEHLDTKIVSLPHDEDPDSAPDQVLAEVIASARPPRYRDIYEARARKGHWA